MTRARETLERLLARNGLTWTRGITLFKFLAAGFPAFLLALPLNWFLVEHGHVPKSLAYALVMALQVSINFFMCRIFVFERKDNQSMLREFGAFFSGIMLFRLGDWCVYMLLVRYAGWYYLFVQVFNVAVFGLLKFLFSERVFRQGKVG